MAEFRKQLLDAALVVPGQIYKVRMVKKVEYTVRNLLCL